MKRTKAGFIILLAVIICCQLAVVVGTSVNRGYHHSDESWSYGFANDQQGGYIYPIEFNDNRNDIMGQWNSGEEFIDYLTVQTGEQFDYAAVLDNQKNDLHPPLHTLILHSICSFFPDQFSWWFSFIINILAFIGAQICLFLLARRLLRSPWAALAVVLGYGFCIEAVNTFVYLRPYALEAFLCLLFVLLCVRLRQRNYEKCTVTYVALFAVAFLGAYNDTLFLVFAFVVTLAQCIELAIRRRWKAFFSFGLSVLIGVLLALVAFSSFYASLLNPVDVASADSEASGDVTDPVWRFVYCLQLVFKETVGILLPEDYNSVIVIGAFVLFVVVVLIAALSFLLRNEEWFKRFIAKVKHAFSNVASRMGDSARNTSGSMLFVLYLILAMIAYLIFVSKTVNVIAMAALSDRYLMTIAPYLWIVLIWIVWRILDSLIKRNLLKSLIIVVLSVALAALTYAWTGGSNYLFPRNSTYDSSVDEIAKGCNVVLVTSSAWQMEYWCAELLGCNNFFAMEAHNCQQYTDALKLMPSSTGDVYVILPTSEFLNENGLTPHLQAIKDAGGEVIIKEGAQLGAGVTVDEFLSYLRDNNSWVTETEYVGSEDTFAGKIQIYKLR